MSDRHYVLAPSAPPSLQHMVRYILKSFYTPEQSLVVDYLIRYPCIKDDQIAALLRFDRKHTRSLVHSLKADKILGVRIRMETNLDTQRSQKANFYFVDYRSAVNSFKYRLDHMRKKLEMEQRDFTSRSAFFCPTCQKTFTDFEVGQLLEENSGRLLCTYCFGEVQEEGGDEKDSDDASLLVSFNETLSPVFALFKDIDEIKLPQNILQPDFTDANIITKLVQGQTVDVQRVGEQSNDTEHTTWSGDRNKNLTFGSYSSDIIAVGDEAIASEKSADTAKKVMPIWMSQSTITNTLPVELKKDEDLDTETNFDGNQDQSDNPVFDMLLTHERKKQPVETFSHESIADDVNPSNPGTENVKFTLDADSDLEEMQDTLTMMIGNEMYEYTQITPEMVNKMTAIEKAEYNRLAQQMYADQFE